MIGTASLLLALISPAAAQPPGGLAPGQAPQLVAEQQALREEMAALREAVAELQEDPLPAQAATIGLGKPVDVPPGAQHEEVVAFGSDIVVRGHVIGDAVALGGDVVIAPGGAISGDAVALGGAIQLREGGRLEGEQLAIGVPGAGLDLAPTVDEHHAIGSMQLASDTSLLLQQMFHRLVGMLSIAGAGVLIVGLFPRRVRRVAQDLEQRPVRAATVGVLTSGFVGLFALLLGVSTLGVGLPVSALLALGLAVAWLLGFVGLCEVVGDRLPLERRPHGRWLAFLVGVGLFTLIGSLPWIGWLVIGAASTIGIGAAVSTRFGAPA